MPAAIPMVEVRILLAKMATFLATKDASQQGRNMLFLVQPPAEDFAVVIFVNRVCLWTTPDGPVPALDVRPAPPAATCRITRSHALSETQHMADSTKT